MLAVHHPVRLPTPSHGAHRHQRGRSIEVSPVASNRISYEKGHSPQRQRTPAFSCRITTSFDSTTEKTSAATPPLSSPALSTTPSSLASSPYHSSSASYDYFDSPPSPPRSLEDQVHVAYALDDIHLAKVLLLKLKGIDVTGDDDPRIAAVKDEDFDVCFVPNGRLVDGFEDQRVKSMEEERLRRQREEMEEERKRQERLKECERKWEEEKRRLKEEREIARQQREDRRREDEQSRQEYEQSLRHQQRRRASAKMPLGRTHSSPARNLVSYRLSSSDPRSAQNVGSDGRGGPFMYDFMITTSTPHPPAACSYTPRGSSTTNSSLSSSPTSMSKNPSASSFSRAPRSHSHSHSQYLDYPYPHHSEGNSRMVTFSEVLTSMQGPLFPGDRKLNVNTLSTSSGSGRSTLVGSAYSHCSAGLGAADEKRRKQTELLESLLKVVEWEEGERRRQKGKGKAEDTNIQRPKVARKDSGKSIKLAACTVCSSLPSSSSPSSTSTSSSSSTLSSSSSRLSWLSFSSASISTLATTPSSSLLLESPTSPKFGRRASSWFASSAFPPKGCSPLRQKSCPHIHLVPIAASESPLPIPVVKTKTHRRSGSKLAPVSTSSNPLTSPFSSIARVESVHTPTPLAEYAKTEPRPSSKVITVVRTQVWKFFELAKGFQDAYVNATMVSVSNMTAGLEPEGMTVEKKKLERRTSERKGVEAIAKPAGARVAPQDVKKFLGTSLRRSPSQLVRNQQADSFGLQPCAKVVPPLPPFLRTPLPETPSYKTHFKPVHQPCRSPFRLRTSRSPSCATHFPPTHPYFPYQEEGVELPPPPKSMFSPMVIPTEEVPRGRRDSSTSGEKIIRVRAVENPVCLRVKAACRRYLDHRAGDRFRGCKGRIPVEEGPLPVMRDGSLGGGGERLLQVVLEGVGRSQLAGEDELSLGDSTSSAGRKCFDLPVFEDSESEEEMDEEMEEMVEFISMKSSSPYHSVRVQVSLSERQVQQMQRGRQRERGGRHWA